MSCSLKFHNLFTYVLQIFLFGIFCSSFQFVSQSPIISPFTCKISMANLKLMNNLVVLSHTLTLRMVSCGNWFDDRNRRLLEWAAIDCLVAISGGMIMLNVTMWIVICTYDLGLLINLFSHYTFSSLGTPGTPLQNTGVLQNSVWETLS